LRFLLSLGLTWLLYAPGALARSTANAAAPSFEIVRQDVDLEAAPDGRYWLTSEIAYRPLNLQGVEAVQQYTSSFTAGYQEEQISAYTLKKDGRRLTVAPDEILRGHGQTTMPGFEDTRTQTVVFPNVEVGDQVVISTTTRQLVPWFPDAFAIGFSYSRAVAVKQGRIAFTSQSDDSAFRISVKGYEADAPQTLGGKTRRVWRFRNEIAVKSEPDSIVEADDAPHVRITTLRDYGAVAKIYAGIFRAKAAVTPEISALADQLTKDIKDRRGRARALYNWVSGHIRYVNIVLGAGGFEPHKAADVLKNGYGDCKDHVMLLEALLAAKGIKSSPVLILAGGDQFKIQAAPSPFLFNHLITYVPEFDLFLDSTAQYAPFGALPDSDAGRGVVIVTSGKLARTPLATAANTSIASETTLVLHVDGTAEGDTNVTGTGALAVAMRAAIASLPADGDDNFFRMALGPGSEGRLVRGKPDDLDIDYSYAAHYRIAHLAAFPGPAALPAQISFKPFSFIGVIGRTLPPSRDTNYLCASGKFSDTVTVTLPPGVAVMSLPPSRVVSAQDVDLRLDYQEIRPGTVRARIELIVNHPDAVCTADYYTKVRPQLSAMTSALLSQILYK
jgi:transglutaminase-like putative cysteine protease